VSNNRQRNIEVTDEVLTPANIVTAVRLALLPVFLVILIGYENNAAAFFVLLVAALTDLIDGQLARFTNTVSELGILLDPFVDRYFIFSAILGLFTIGRLPVWLFILLFARDGFLLVFNFYLRKKNHPVFEVAFLGKLATATLMAGFCSLVLYWPIIPGLALVEHSWLPGLGLTSGPLGNVLVYLGVIFSVTSAMYYVVRGLSEVTSEQAGTNTASVAATVFIPETDVNASAEVKPAGDI